MLLQELLPSLDIRILALGHLSPGTWWNYRGVHSTYNRLFLVLGGEAFVRHHGREYRMTPGDMHMVPCFMKADYYCHDTFDLCYVAFDSRLSGGGDLFQIQEYDYARDARPADHDSFGRLLELIPNRALPVYDPALPEYERYHQAAHEFYRTMRPEVYLESQGLLRLLLAPFVASGRGMNLTSAEMAGRLHRVLMHIDRHLTESITLDDLAAVAGLNPNYFSDSFQRAMRIRPIEYINQSRVMEAQIRLATTAAPVKAIAYELGFTTPQYFARVFKALVGVTPTQYRKLQSHAV
jgi:AraC-like DNA-binding protein